VDEAAAIDDFLSIGRADVSACHDAGERTAVVGRRIVPQQHA
jgi:hypothetical protein